MSNDDPAARQAQGERMSEQERDSSPAMGVANMLRVHVLPYIAQVENADARQRLMELYDSMMRVALSAHHAR